MFIENKYVSGKLEKWVVGVGWGGGGDTVPRAPVIVRNMLVRRTQ